MADNNETVSHIDNEFTRIHHLVDAKLSEVSQLIETMIQFEAGDTESLTPQKRALLKRLVGTSIEDGQKLAEDEVKNIIGDLEATMLDAVAHFYEIYNESHHHEAISKAVRGLVNKNHDSVDETLKEIHGNLYETNQATRRNAIGEESDKLFDKNIPRNSVVEVEIDGYEEDDSEERAA